MLDKENLCKKINILNKIEDENCKYICKVYEKYFLQNKITFNHCSYKDSITLIQNKFLEINDLSKTTFEYILKNYEYDVKLYIDLNNYEIGKNWFYDTQNNMYNILYLLMLIDENSLRNDPINTVKQIFSKNLKSKKHVAYNVSKKTQIYKLVRFIDKLKTKLNVQSLNFVIEFNDLDTLRYNYVLDEFIKIIDIINSNTQYEKQSKVYDYLCEYLDNEFTKYDYCNFENNQCIAQRDKNNKFDFPFEQYNGCCFDVKIKKPCSNLNCESCKKCNIKSISCKLLICGYLRQWGIEYNIYHNVLTRSFLNLNSKLNYVWDFFTDKNEMIRLKNQKN